MSRCPWLLGKMPRRACLQSSELRRRLTHRRAELCLTMSGACGSKVPGAPRGAENKLFSSSCDQAQPVLIQQPRTEGGKIPGLGRRVAILEIKVKPVIKLPDAGVRNLTARPPLL